MKQKNIYLVRLGYTYPYWIICTGIVQYGFEETHELFSYHQHITLTREVNIAEAEMLYELIKSPNGLCAGRAIETIEL